MPLKYTSNSWPRFEQTVPTITKIINNIITVDEFFEYLSNTDVTWGSPNTVVLLEVNRFKLIVKDFLKFKNEKDEYIGSAFVHIWKKIDKKLSRHKYLVIQ